MMPATVTVGAVLLIAFLAFLVSAIATGEQKANRRAIQDLNRRVDHLNDKNPASPEAETIDESDHSSDSTK